MIDSHAHILKRYYEEDFDLVLAESISNLDMIINISFSINSSKEVVELAKTNDKLKAVIGVHPNDVNKLSGDYISEIENLIDENVVAIGEVGLDYHYEGYDKELQKKIFIEFIELARKHNLPVVVHSREANEDTINIIKEYSDVKFLFHSWSGTVEQTKELNEWGNVWFSYNGIITFKNAESVREAFLATRKDRVLLETDCPYLTPVPFRGKTNYPKYVEYVYNYVNELDGTTEEQIDSNVKEFFNV